MVINHFGTLVLSKKAILQPNIGSEGKSRPDRSSMVAGGPKRLTGAECYFVA